MAKFLFEITLIESRRNDTSSTTGVVPLLPLEKAQVSPASWQGKHSCNPWYSCFTLDLSNVFSICILRKLHRIMVCVVPPCHGAGWLLAFSSGRRWRGGAKQSRDGWGVNPITQVSLSNSYLSNCHKISQIMWHSHKIKNACPLSRIGMKDRHFLLGNHGIRDLE